MTLYSVMPAYDKNNHLYYQVLPYDVIGTIHNHFKFYNGLFSLIPFLLSCRLSRKRANRVANKLQNRS